MDLQNVIDKAAARFATEVMEAIRSVPLAELLETRPDAAPVIAKKKAGRPKKVTVVKAAKPAKKAPKKAKKHSYPKCSVKGCTNTMWARGEGMCGEHFKKAKAIELVVKKPAAKKPKKVKPPKTPTPSKAKKAAKPAKEPKSKMAPMGKDAAIAKNAAAEAAKE